jgi:hypothetical protein
MTFAYDPGRQYPLVAEAVLDYDDLLPSATEVDIVKLPPGSRVLDVRVYVDTAFDAAGTDLFSVGDSDSATLYANGVDVATTGAKTTAGFGKKYASSETLIGTYTHTSTAPTAGSLRVTVTYVVEGRVNEIQAPLT